MELVYDNEDDDDFILPYRKRGRQSDAARELYKAQVRGFCRFILKITSRLDFKVSSRGFGYILENEGKITKGQLDHAQDIINDCRKDGSLPWDICAEDDTRACSELDEEDVDSTEPEEEAREIIEYAYATYNDAALTRDSAIRLAEAEYADAEGTRDAYIANGHRGYKPWTFWDTQPYYIEMWTEKIDLRNLFKPICDELGIRIANAKGWNDINSRVKLLKRFAEQARRGKICVLLYCGDFDPGGLQISEFLRANLKEVSGAAGFWFENESDLIIDRFGLNYDFIEANHLTWIDNLETSAGKSLWNPEKPEDSPLYVRNYVEKYKVRKVEANALVVAPVAGRQLCRQAIEHYLPDDYHADYQQKLRDARDEVKAEIERLLAERDE